MAKKDREKLRKAKAKKAKNVQAAKSARAETKDGQASIGSQSKPFGVDSVGRAVPGSSGGGGAGDGGGSPLMPRRSKKG
ncbi:MAG: hypothetical protein O7G85_10100 [Planctomycetota bacterium]|nr:hypothetical protein [Planctomycetota bacterium]